MLDPKIKFKHFLKPVSDRQLAELLTMLVLAYDQKGGDWKELDLGDVTPERFCGFLEEIDNPTEEMKQAVNIIRQKYIPLFLNG